MKYVIITPAKDEEKYIENTLRSVINQTLTPKEWIIVNDGSIDNTRKIVEKYSEKYSWLRLLNVKCSNKKRTGGSKVVEVFYKGYRALNNHEYDFIVKLDADLTFTKNYFAKVAKGFREDGKVGICGGYCVVDRNGSKIKERSHEQHLRGAIKAYRKKCFADIGGLRSVLGWDGLDQYMALYHDWQIKILPIPVTHHRVTGQTSDQVSLNFDRGLAYYKNGQDLFLLLLGAIARSYDGPFYAGLYMVCGFLYGILVRENKSVEKDIGRFIRKVQYKRIINKLKAIKVGL